MAFCLTLLKGRIVDNPDSVPESTEALHVLLVVLCENAISAKNIHVHVSLATTGEGDELMDVNASAPLQQQGVEFKKEDEEDDDDDEEEMEGNMHDLLNVRRCCKVHVQ